MVCIHSGSAGRPWRRSFDLATAIALSGRDASAAWVVTQAAKEYLLHELPTEQPLSRK